jgi:acyl-CoA thioesterase-1
MNKKEPNAMPALFLFLAAIMAAPMPPAPLAAALAIHPPHAEAQKPEVKTILFFGDSITAGYGIDPDQAFPALIQEKINALGWPFKAVNGGVSGETSAGGLRRIDWVLQQRVDVFILELGANDALRGVDLQETEKNLQGIIDRVRTKYPEARIVLAGMQAPPNLGQAYTDRFRTLFPDLAKKNSAGLIPFLLEGVGGVRGLNLPDGIHPTPRGHALVAETVWTVLKPILASLR